jgi:hypothetical protein
VWFLAVLVSPRRKEVGRKAKHSEEARARRFQWRPPSRFSLQVLKLRFWSCGEHRWINEIDKRANRFKKVTEGENTRKGKSS